MNEAERLKEFRISLGLSQADLAKHLGMKQGSYSSLEIARNNISDRVKKILSSRFKLNIKWLEAGDGYMFLDMGTLKGRLNFIMNEYKHNTRDMAYTAKINEAKLIKVLQGDETLTNEEISRLSAGYQDYSTQWILNGQGDVYDKRIIKANNSLIQQGGDNTKNISPNFNNNNQEQFLLQQIESLKTEVELLKKIIAMYEQNKS